MYNYQVAKDGGGSAAPPPPQPSSSSPLDTTTSSNNRDAIIAAYKEENRKLVEAVEVMRAASPTSGALEAKYLQQIKKTRQLTVELASEKTNVSRITQQLAQAVEEKEKLRAKVKDHKSIVDMLGGEHSHSNHASSQDQEEEDSANARVLKERLDRSFAQIREKDLQLLELRRESAAIKKVLAREVGKSAGDDIDEWVRQVTDTPREKASRETSGWKGRAEHIVLLQGKVKDLQRALAAAQQHQPPSDGDNSNNNKNSDREDFIRNGGGDDLESLMMLCRSTGNESPRPSHGNSNEHHPSNKKSVDDVARDRVQDMANKRLKAQHDTERELQQLKQQVVEEKGKATALNARLTSVQRENTQLRSQMHVVLGKSTQDDELLSAYKEELTETAKVMHDMKTELEELRREVWGAPDEDAEGGRGGGKHRAVSSPPPHEKKHDGKENNRQVIEKLFRRRSSGGSDDAVVGDVSLRRNNNNNNGEAMDELRRQLEESEKQKVMLSVKLTMLERFVAQHFEEEDEDEEEDAAGSQQHGQLPTLSRQLLEWMLDASYGDGNVCSSSSNDEAVTAEKIGSVLRAAHQHVVLLESQQLAAHRNTEKIYTQYQQWLDRVSSAISSSSAGSDVKGNSFKSGSLSAVKNSNSNLSPVGLSEAVIEKLTAQLAALPPVDEARATEVANLKDRIASLTALIKKDAAAQAACWRRPPGTAAQLSSSSGDAEKLAMLQKQYNDLKKAFNQLQLAQMK